MAVTMKWLLKILVMSFLLIFLIIFPAYATDAEIVPYSDGMMWGFRSMDHSIYMDLIYDSVYSVEELDPYEQVAVGGGVLAVGDDDGKLYVYKSDGTQLTQDFYTSVVYKCGMVFLGKNDCVMAVNLNGEVIIPAVHEYLLYDGQYYLGVDTADDGSYGFLFYDAKGNMLSSIQLGDVQVFSFSEGKLLVGSMMGIKYYTIQGNPAFDFPLDSGEAFVNGKAVVYQGELCGLIDELGNLVLSIEYNSIDNESNGIILATKGGISYLFDSDLTLIMEVTAKQLILQPFGGVIMVQDDGPEKAISVQASAILEISGKHIEQIAVDKYLVMGGSDSNQIFCIYNVDGSKVLEMVADDASYIGDGLVLVSVDGRYGLVDTNGEEVLGKDFDSIERIWKGCFMYKKSNMMGVVDREGALIFSVEL